MAELVSINLKLDKEQVETLKNLITLSEPGSHCVSLDRNVLNTIKTDLDTAIKMGIYFMKEGVSIL